MNQLINRLLEDHKQLIGVLYHLEREIKVYAGLSRRLPNLDSILDVLDYLNVYPQIWHHSTEDIIYKVLIKKNFPDKTLVVQLQDEHGILDTLTEYLHQSFDSIARNRCIPTARLVKRTSDFIQRQLDHIKQEQRAFFPSIELFLTANDWEAIEAQVALQMNRPDGVKWQEYQTLYRNIVEGSALTAY